MMPISLQTTTLCYTLFFVVLFFPRFTHANNSNNNNNILVVGSANADTFLPVQRLPVEGENLTTDGLPTVNVPGGKGCTQAVAAAKLGKGKVTFWGQLGRSTDACTQQLKQTLQQRNVDCTPCRYHEDLPTGQGYVFLTRSGQVSAVVSGGSNQYGWKDWEPHQDQQAEQQQAKEELRRRQLDQQLQNVQCVMLQREIPEYVNRIVAQYCKEHSILVVQDVGGEDRPMDADLLACVDYLVPNETELRRLVESFGRSARTDKHDDDDNDDDDNDNDESVIAMARYLQRNHGAKHILVTQGRHGCTLIPADNGKIVHQPALPVATVVDETGAGDAFRAAFCVALLEHGSNNDTPRTECLQFASAAGACAVQVQGAVPATPSRAQVEELLQQHQQHASQTEQVLKIPRGDGLRQNHNNDDNKNDDTHEFPFLIGSRLNSMKDHPEVWKQQLKTPHDFVQRQATVPGLTCVDFNYPQHFHTWTPAQAKTALYDAGLVAGAVCLRYPAKFARGAMNHPDATLRQEAVELTKQAAHAARTLGCPEVVVWSAFDGYDYPFQVNYNDKWDELIQAFRECCDAFPDLLFSLEFKPTDENTRFFTVPSTGAALLFVHDVDRTNFGLTLDVGHMLMAGENPGQSIALVGRAGKLFGIQLNDGFTRLAAEDGLMFGSVHPSMALEIVYQLKRVGFAGHLYFDTFPQRTDPVEEAAYNIERVKAFWRVASSLSEERLRRIQSEHDAVGALRMIDEALKQL